MQAVFYSPTNPGIKYAYSTPVPESEITKAQEAIQAKKKPKPEITETEQTTPSDTSPPAAAQDSGGSVSESMVEMVTGPTLETSGIYN